MTISKGALKVVSEIKGKWGDDDITVLEGMTEVKPVDVIPTGCLSLDMALQCGGIPRERMTEFFGPEGGGKTTMAYTVMANVLRNGGVAVYIDTEQKGDLLYMQRVFKQFGVDLEGLIVSRPSCGAAALEILEKMIGHCDLIVLDSVPNIATQTQLESSPGDVHVGVLPRLLNDTIRRVNAKITGSKTAIVLINQIRDQIGNSYGPTEITPGGHYLRHAYAMRIRLNQVGATLKEKGIKVGIPVKATVRKNQVGAPWQTANFNILWGIGEDGVIGIDRVADIAGMAVEYEIIKKSGSWYSYAEDTVDEIKVQGLRPIINMMKEDSKLLEQIADRVREAMEPEEGEDG